MKKSKVIIASSVTAAAGSNPYLDSDNHLNIEKVMALQAKVKAVEADFPTENDKGRAIKPPKPVQTFIIARKAKPIKASAALQKKGDLKYLTRRAVKVGTVKRLTEKSAIRNLPLLTVYEPALMGKLAASVKQAVSAILKHQKSADKTKAGVTKVKTKVRDASNKVFDGSLKKLQAILSAGGLKDKDLVMSKGMYGMSMLVNLGGDNVISIGKSDPAKFKDARKAAATAE